MPPATVRSAVARKFRASDPGGENGRHRRWRWPTCRSVASELLLQTVAGYVHDTSPNGVWDSGGLGAVLSGTGLALLGRCFRHEDGFLPCCMAAMRSVTSSAIIAVRAAANL